MKNLPNMITVFGLALGLAGLSLYPSIPGLVFMGLSLLCDVTDGWVARRYDAATPFGAMLDWSADVAMAHIGVYKLFGLWGNAVLAIGHAFALDVKERISGRTFVFVMLAVMRFIP